VRITLRNTFAIVVTTAAISIGAGFGAAGPASAAFASTTTGYAPIYNYNDDLCLGIAASGKAGQYNCTEASNQEWYIAATSDTGGVTIENLAGQCLYAANTEQSTQVQANTGGCTGNEYWYKLNENSDGCVNLAWTSSSADVMGIDAGSLSSGAHAILWPSNGKPNQFWCSLIL
jgi:Ricin-type beta-trefoil lectin domain-like